MSTDRQTLGLVRLRLGSQKRIRIVKIRQNQILFVLSYQNIPKSKSEPIIRKAPTIFEVVTSMNEE